MAIPKRPQTNQEDFISGAKVAEIEKKRQANTAGRPKKYSTSTRTSLVLPQHLSDLIDNDADEKTGGNKSLMIVKILAAHYDVDITK